MRPFEYCGPVRKHTQSCSAAPVVVAVVAAIVGASLALAGAHPTSAAPLTPLQEAVAYTYALRVATTDAAAARAVKMLLARLQVPVLPNTYAGDGIGIYDFQVDIVAKAFREGKLTRLDQITGVYADSGVSFGGDSSGATQQPTGFAVEKAMRDLRQKAEKAKSDSGTFPLLLMDALGRRDERPMDLMEVHEPGCADKADAEALFSDLPTGPNGKIDPIQQKAADTISGIVAQRTASGAASSAGLGGLAAMMSAMAPQIQQALGKSGSAFTVDRLKGLVGEAQAKQVEVPRLAADATPEDRKLQEASQTGAESQRAGGDGGNPGQGNEATAMMRLRDVEKATFDRLEAERATKVEETEFDKMQGADRAFELIGGRALELWAASDAADERYEDKDYIFQEIREQQEETRREDAETKNLRMSIPMPNLTGSCLWLDAVQVLVLQVSVFDLDKAALIVPVEEGVLK